MSSIPLPALGIKPGENPLTGYAKALSIRGEQQQQQMQQEQLKGAHLQNESAQMDIDSQRAITRAYTESQGDLNKTIPLAAQYGAKPDALMKIKTAYLTQQEAALKLSDSQRAQALQSADLVRGAHDQVSALPPEQRPAAYQQALMGLKNAGVDISQMPPQYPGDEAFQISGASIQGHQQMLKDAETIAATNKNNAQTNEANASIPGKQAQSDAQVRSNAASQLASSKDQAEYEQKLGEMPYKIASQFPKQFDKDAVLQAGMTPHEQASVPVEKMEFRDWSRERKAKGLPASYAEFAQWKATLAPAARLTIENGLTSTPKASDGSTDVAAQAKKFGMSAEAFDQQAEKYFQTGQLPALGRGITGPALQRSLMNRAAELHPEGDLAGNAAAYAANKDSLKKLQTNFDQVSAFESTAKKNIDLLQSTAAKIPDLGSRFANTPVRAISGNMIGSENMAAFKTALNTAQTEAAKVLNSSNASGVLSDSARHELQDIIDGNLPFKSMVASLNTLKQDMTNRHQAYSDQISDIQKRMATKKGGGGSTSNAAPSDSSDPFAAFGGKKH